MICVKKGMIAAPRSTDSNTAQKCTCIF